MPTLSPGSDEARAEGCICPVLDNAHGKGRYGDGEAYGWWMHEDCPMHGYLAAHLGEATADSDGGEQDRDLGGDI